MFLKSFISYTDSSFIRATSQTILIINQYHIYIFYEHHHHKQQQHQNYQNQQQQQQQLSFHLNCILFVITECADDKSEGHSANSLKQSQQNNPDGWTARGHVENVDHENQDQRYLLTIQNIIQVKRKFSRIIGDLKVQSFFYKANDSCVNVQSAYYFNISK